MAISAEDALRNVNDPTLSDAEKTALANIEQFVDNNINQRFDGRQISFDDSQFDDFIKREKSIQYWRKKAIVTALKNLYISKGWDWSTHADRDGSYIILKPQDKK